MPPINYWQGRKHELAAIQEWLSQPSTVLVGITGLGGFGKSTLAAKLLDKSTGSRKFWADVRTGTDFSSLARRVLVAWGMAAEQVQAIPELNLPAALVRQLQEQPGLLVIDNVESLLNEAGEWQNPVYQQFLQDWIEFGKQSQLLLTSRERPVLEARRTRWYALEQGLSAAEGAALLRDLGIRGETAELEALVSQVGGYPLSLMLVAGLLLAEEEPDPQVRYLSHYGNLFQIRGLHRGENQTSIEQVFGWSFARLSPALQHLLAQISVFRRAFNVTAAAALLPDTQITEAELRQLVRRSLLQELPRDKTDQRQFQLQPQVRELVQQRAGNLTAAHERAIIYYREVITSPEITDKVTADLEIFYHCCELAEYEQAYFAIDFRYQFLYKWGRYTTLVEVYKQLVEEWQPANRGEQDSVGWAWMRLGVAYKLLGESTREVKSYQRARTIFSSIVSYGEEALDTSATSENRLHEFFLKSGCAQPALNGLVASLDALGGFYCYSGQFLEAIHYYEQAVEVAQRTGNYLLQCNSLQNLGRTHHEFEQYPQAIDCYQQSLILAQNNKNQQEEATALLNIGLVYCTLKQYLQAIKTFRQALRLARKRDLQKVGNTLNNLGFAYKLTGRFQRALKFQEYYLKMMRQSHNRREEARALKDIAEVYNSLGKHRQAVEHQQQALDIVKETSDRQSEAFFSNYLGKSHYYLGEYEQAKECHQQALNIAQQIGYRRGEADFLFSLGVSLEHLNQKSEAGKAYQQASELYTSMKLITKEQECKTALQRLEKGSS